MEADEKKRLVNVGQKHAAFVLGSLSLWGVSDYWADETDLILAIVHSHAAFPFWLQ